MIHPPVYWSSYSVTNYSKAYYTELDRNQDKEAGNLLMASPTAMMTPSYFKFDPQKT